MINSLLNSAIDTAKKAVAYVQDKTLQIFCGVVAAGAAAEAGAQTTPEIYDPGVNISGMTTVAADGLGDVVITALAVAFGFLVIALGFGWAKKYMRSK